MFIDTSSMLASVVDYKIFNLVGVSKILIIGTNIDASAKLITTVFLLFELFILFNTGVAYNWVLFKRSN